MDSEALVQLALDAQSCNQKELGLRLGVSPTQISKWKKGEHMSFEMREKLSQLANIGSMCPQFVLWAGSLEDARKWARLIDYLAERAVGEAETGYDTYPLTDEPDLRELLCSSTFHTLKEMGVAIPKQFPATLDVEVDDEDNDSVDRYEALLESNPYSSTIDRLYRSLNDVYGFYAAYVSGLVDDDALDLLGTPAENIEPCLLSLAACKIEVDPAFAPNFAAFNRATKENYEIWLNIVKDRAFSAGKPLRAELLNLVYDSGDELGHEAEAESLGFNATRLHPDVYMNELLVGMRLIHQVLPAILEKLGIEGEFALDRSKLQLG
ncbi:hypothetical protein DFR29_12428 [Tahibacter aquaticus]|uniref:Uncharacterized protein n=1 Tax=Tahibacter aquaticus TaxID=520092 RepID=A0A4R6YKR6_9GAMM|nr:helix-turn-helix transcriptional regulator [Tahibacter aquaticus]TDR37731.1 hypothetical protein DFR29_12428 [Tahibacter aquaticus]